MYEEVKLLTHSSIKISGQKTVYFDPYEVKDEYHDADVVCVTHDHYDHYSTEDIKRVAKEDTVLVLPKCMKGQEKLSGVKNCRFVRPDETLAIGELSIRAVRSYNVGKPFHPKSNDNVGYILTMNGVSYYVAGDTDATAEAKEVKCDVALVPVGGKFTMDVPEAAELVNHIKPALAVPTHYGTVAGSPKDGKKFEKLIDKDIEVRVMM